MHNNGMIQWLKMHFIPHEGNGHRPHILHPRNVHRIFGVVVFIELFAFLIPTIAFVGRADNATILPSILSNLTNQQRIEQRLPTLTVSPELTAAAQAKANDMAAKSYFAHTSPDGKTPWYWIEQAGYRYSYAGENLAVNFTDAQDVTNAWMNSPEHRANILKADYTQIGTGVAEGIYQGYNTIFVAQDFGTPLAVGSTISIPVPTPPSVSIAPKATTKVLGAETVTSPTSARTAAPVAVSQPAPVVHPNLWQKLESSPHATTNVILFVILALVLVAVLLNIGIKISHQHPDLILNGFMLIAMIGCVLVMNNYISNGNAVATQSVDFTASHTVL